MPVERFIDRCPLALLVCLSLAACSGESRDGRSTSFLDAASLNFIGYSYGTRLAALPPSS